jgi:hypothetical protein
MNCFYLSKQLLLLAATWLSFGNVHAQNDSIKLGRVKQQASDIASGFRNNVVYGELLGNMGGLSLNYERKIYKHKQGFFTARIGVGFGGIDLAGFPILINHVFFKHNNHLEVGGGVRIVAAHYKSHYSLYNFKLDKYYSVVTANLTYRYQKPRGRFVFRVGWTPLYYPNPYDGLYAFAAILTCGISAGYVF